MYTGMDFDDHLSNLHFPDRFSGVEMILHFIIGLQIVKCSSLNRLHIIPTQVN